MKDRKPDILSNQPVEYLVISSRRIVVGNNEIPSAFLVDRVGGLTDAILLKQAVRKCMPGNTIRIKEVVKDIVQVC